MHNGARTANCLHTRSSPETAAVSDHIFTVSPLKWTMINCLEAFGNRLMPARGRPSTRCYMTEMFQPSSGTRFITDIFGEDTATPR